jgi:hypothetical protein
MNFRNFDRCPDAAMNGRTFGAQRQLQNKATRRSGPFCILFLVAGLATLAGILCLLAGFLIWVLTLLAGLLVWILTLLTGLVLVCHRVSFQVGEQRTTMGSFVRSKKYAQPMELF